MTEEEFYKWWQHEKRLKIFFNELCDLIDMERCKRTFWDYHWYPKFVIKLMGWDKDDKVYGSSAVQFIMTSNITVHTINNLKHVYIHIFRFNDFN